MDERAAVDAIRHARSLGINFFDTAQAYGFGRAERLLGRPLAAELRASREELVIATKGGLRMDGDRLIRDASPAWLRKGVEASFRAWLEHKQGRPVSDMTAANRWLEEVYEPVIDAIPEDLRGRLPPAGIFHEVLEHRWYMSEAVGRDVGTAAAAAGDYFKHVLPTMPAPPDYRLAGMTKRSQQQGITGADRDEQDQSHDRPWT